MCGICGYTGDVDFRLLDTMKATLRHRGPDDAGVKINDKVGLGHVRLKVIDTSTLARQPMCNKEATVWISYSGAVYGHDELRKSLEQEGYRFGSLSDTEVIIHLYQKHGLDFVDHLRGQFALALWDEYEERLILARDRLGIKPLYWTQLKDGHIAFGSEIKAMLEHPEVGRDVDRHALCDYLSYLYVPPPRTLFKGIFKLEPGHMLLLKDGKITKRAYWNPETEGGNGRDPGELIDESVRLCMRSDVPIGAFLSGGPGSSAVVSRMSRHARRPVRTFTLVFDHDKARACAKEVAQRIGAEHHEIKAAPDAISLLPEVVRHFDEPNGNPAALFSYVLAQKTSKHVTVVLGGDGGEEIFGAYPDCMQHLGHSGLFDMSMAHGLDLRLPLLDHELIECMARHPMSTKERWRKELMPESTLASGPKGIDPPLDGWFKRELDALAKDLLSPRQVRRRGLFDASTIQRNLYAHIVLECWLKTYMD